MNIEIMRYADYWLGVPLCFLLSCFNSIFKTITFRPKPKNTVQKILFIKLSELGAIILSYPLLKRIKENYASAELFFVTFSRNKDIFCLLDEIIPDKNILVIRENNPGLIIFDTLKVITRLRREKIDIVFDLEFFVRFTAIITYLIKANKRVGFYRYGFEGLYRGTLLTHKMQYNPLIHISKNYLSLSQAVQEENKHTPELYTNIKDKEILFPRYISEKTPEEKLRIKLHALGIAAGKNKIFLINPGEGVLPVREWPLNNFTSLAKKILSGINNRIIIVGTEKTAQKAEILLTGINDPRCLSLIGQTDLRELMELFIKSEALISNDCGLAHLAMLTPIKKFIIFGPESPRIFGPLDENSRVIYSNWPCSPCLSVLNHRKSVCKNNKCLKVIQPDDIYALISNSPATNN